MSSADPDLPLTHASKAAIRNYMVSVIAIPSLILAIATAIGGYLLARSQEVLQQSALLDARNQANTVLNEIQRDLSSLSAQSRAALTVSKREQEEIQDSYAKMKVALEAVKGATELSNVVGKLDESLSRNSTFQASIAKQVAPAQIVASEVISTPGDCAAPRRKLLGTFPGVKFCALSMSQSYRHGQNKGGLLCQVVFEQNQWSLVASGPTHECGSQGGASSGQCQAVCWQ